MTSLHQRFRRWAGFSLANELTFLASAIAVMSTVSIAILSFSIIIWSSTKTARESLEAKAAAAAARIQQAVSATSEVQASLARSALFIDALMDSQGRDIYLVPFIRRFDFPIATPVRISLCDLNGKWLAGNTTEQLRCDIEAGLLQSPGLTRQPFTYIRSLPGGGIGVHTIVGIIGPMTGQVDGFLEADYDLGPVARRLGPELGLESLRIGPRGPAGEAGSGSVLPKDMLHTQTPIFEGLAGLGQARWSLWASTRTAESSQKLHVLGGAYLAALFILLWFIFIRARKAAARVFEPLRQLADEAARSSAQVGKGRYEFKPPDDSHREVAELSVAIATMVSKLGAHEEMLERAVEERTRELARNEAYLRNLFEAARDVIIVGTRPDGIIVLFNQGAEGIFGRLSESVIGRMKLEDLIDAEYLARIRAESAGRASDVNALLLEHFGSQSAPEVLQVRCSNGDGAQLRASVRSTTVRPGEEGILLIAQDVTDANRLEMQRQELEERLRQSQKMEAIGTFAGGIAHDFNNILASILGNARLTLEDLPASPEVQENVGEIERAAVRGRDLVQQILSFSRRQPTKRKIIDLHQALSQGMRLLRGVLPATVTLDYLNAADGPVWVDADETQIAQILLNLGSNSAQALAGRPGHLQVRLENRAPGSDGPPGGLPVCIVIEDDGPGIPDDLRARIFEPFFTTKAVGEGTGLGLSVVHGIVSTHGGTIEVSAPSVGGVRFDIRLPLSRPPEVEPAEAVDAEKVAQPSSRRRRVCYLDDDDSLARLVKRMLEREAIEVESFTSQEDCLAWFENDTAQVDLFITDFNMPGITGIDVINRVRQLRSDMRFMIVSGHLSDNLMELARANKVDEVMFKATDMRTFCSRISALIDGPR